MALGGIYLYNDGRDTPDNINGIVEYPDNLVVTFEATLTDMIGKESVDICFHGTGGRLSIFRQGYRFTPADKGAPEITGEHVTRRSAYGQLPGVRAERANSLTRMWSRATTRRCRAT